MLEEEIVKLDMEELYLGNLKTVEFDLQFPAKGRHGSDISWETDDERFLTREGKVSRPLYGMSNREVILTGTFSCGNIQKTKRYVVTILEQENPYKEEEIFQIELPEREVLEDAQPMLEWTDAKVRILPGNEFYDTQERMHRFLLKTDADEMLYHFRKASGLDTKGARSPYGWDAEESKLRGHTTGHFLSALALCYHAVGDEKIKEKALYMVEELGKCQEAFSNIDGIQEGFLSGYSEEQFDLLEEYTIYPRIWAPYYTLHKIMAGLLDCWQYIDSEKALDIVTKMGEWTWRRLGRLPKRQLKKMWSMYIAGEFGGMNEVMAKLAAITGRKEFIDCAKLFDNDKLFHPLEKYQDQLSGMHANQHIPQILGAVEMYKVSGEEKYLNIARAFWKTVTENRCYAQGGVGETEMFHGFREIGALLTANSQESCASYNMLKLSKELYQLEPDAKYMDYYERTLYNHTLATLAGDDSGESTYFFPTGPGMKREFLHENHCCHGTGMEAHFRYREGMYFRKGNDIYINLYIPSELESADGSVKLRIERDSQREQKYRIWVQGEKIQNVYLRVPEWAADVQTEPQKYRRISDDFSEGKWLEFQWKAEFRIRRTPDMPERAAVQYGPYILAALSEEKEFLQASFDETTIAEKLIWSEKDRDEICFSEKDRKWIPIYQINDDFYHTYVLS